MFPSSVLKLEDGITGDEYSALFLYACDPRMETGQIQGKKRSIDNIEHSKFPIWDC